MSKWITDRKPTEKDGPMVYNSQGGVWHYTYIMNGDPWKPIPECEPYVKPKRYTVDGFRDTISGTTWYEVWDNLQETSVVTCIPTWEAAERIAAIYEEVMP